jgi:hypothetical protein
MFSRPSKTERLDAPQVIYVQQAPKRTGCLTWLAAFVLIPGVLVSMCAEVNKTEDRGAKPDPPPSSQPTAEKKAREGDVVMTKQSGRSVYGECIVNATLTNTHKYPVRDIKLAAIIRGESGKRLKTLDYEATITLKPGETRTLTDLSFGYIPEQAAQIEIGVISYSGGP